MSHKHLMGFLLVFLKTKVRQSMEGRKEGRARKERRKGKARQGKD